MINTTTHLFAEKNKIMESAPRTPRCTKQDCNTLYNLQPYLQYRQSNNNIDSAMNNADFGSEPIIIAPIVTTSSSPSPPPQQPLHQLAQQQPSSSSSSSFVAIADEAATATPPSQQSLFMNQKIHCRLENKASLSTGGCIHNDDYDDYFEPFDCILNELLYRQQCNQSTAAASQQQPTLYFGNQHFQPNITPKSRYNLAKWLIVVGQDNGLDNGEVLLALAFIDYSLNQYRLQNDTDLYLLGSACLLITSRLMQTSINALAAAANSPGYYIDVVGDYDYNNNNDDDDVTFNAPSTASESVAKLQRLEMFMCNAMQIDLTTMFELTQSIVQHSAQLTSIIIPFYYLDLLINQLRICRKHYRSYRTDTEFMMSAQKFINQAAMFPAFNMYKSSVVAAASIIGALIETGYNECIIDSAVDVLCTVINESEDLVMACHQQLVNTAASIYAFEMENKQAFASTTTITQTVNNSTTSSNNSEPTISSTTNVGEDDDDDSLYDFDLYDESSALMHQQQTYMTPNYQAMSPLTTPTPMYQNFDSPPHV